MHEAQAYWSRHRSALFQRNKAEDDRRTSDIWPSHSCTCEYTTWNASHTHTQTHELLPGMITVHTGESKFYRSDWRPRAESILQS